MTETFSDAHQPCRVALVGAGGMISEHGRAFADVPGVKLVAITNRTRSKAVEVAKELGGLAVYDTIDEMWAETKADIVIMAVYETAILDVAKNIFSYPWAVFMEKPIGLDLLEAREVGKAAAKAERQVWVGLNRRALGSTTAALDDLADDPGPRFIHVQDQQSLETARVIGHAENVVENWMYANSIHLVDYLLAFGRGKATGIEQIVPWSFNEPGIVIAKVAFESGDIGLYEAIWNGPGPWACTVSTPRRRWELKPLEAAKFQNADERILHNVDEVAADANFKPGFRLQAERVVEAWRGKETTAPTIADALQTTELVASIYQS